MAFLATFVGSCMVHCAWCMVHVQSLGAMTVSHGREYRAVFIELELGLQVLSFMMQGAQLML